jgi:uncharacterized protein (TIGR03435 family)
VVWTSAPSDWFFLAIFLVWLGGFLTIVLIRMRTWRRIEDAVRSSTPLHMPGVTRIQVRHVPGLLEPGIVGWWHPLLLLPADIEHHLTPLQLEAVLAHELCHVKRRDNLTAAIHMVVEAVFWFHPFVWWIGRRLVDERERACDEEVLRSVRERKAYAEGILNVCKRYLESSLVCVSGVGGSNIKKRIEAIMSGHVGEGLNAWRKLLLVMAALLALVTPLGLGVLEPLRLLAQVPTPVVTGSTPAFDVASIKPNQSGALRVTMAPQPGGRFVATNAPLRDIIRNAYQLPGYALIGGPSWVQTDRFDIGAKAPSDLPAGQVRMMLRSLLADRFKLAMHRETRDLPIYLLAMARHDRTMGPELRRAEADCASAPALALDFLGPRDPNAPCGFLGPGAGGNARFRGVTMEAFARFLEPTVHRPVIDRTGLTGDFDMDLELTAELGPPPPPPGVPDRFDRSSAPSIFTALQDKLGLRLESSRGQVEVLVVDHVEQPTPD